MFTDLNKSDAEKIVDIGEKFIKIIINTVCSIDDEYEHEVIFKNLSVDDREKIKNWGSRFKRCSIDVLSKIKYDLDSGNFISEDYEARIIQGLMCPVCEWALSVVIPIDEFGVHTKIMHNHVECKNAECSLFGKIFSFPLPKIKLEKI